MFLKYKKNIHRGTNSNFTASENTINDKFNGVRRTSLNLFIYRLFRSRLHRSFITKCTLYALLWTIYINMDCVLWGGIWPNMLRVPLRTRLHFFSREEGNLKKKIVNDQKSTESISKVSVTLRKINFCLIPNCKEFNNRIVITVFLIIRNQIEFCLVHNHFTFILKET